MKVLLTDISYLAYGNNKRSYLSVIKYSSTNEILAYNVSNNLELEVATTTIEILCHKNLKLNSECFIHSDQEVHYTSSKHKKLLKSKNIK